MSDRIIVQVDTARFIAENMRGTDYKYVKDYRRDYYYYKRISTTGIAGTRYNTSRPVVDIEKIIRARLDK